jgi:hypothetical protein
VPIKIFAEESAGDDANISINEMKLWESKYYYDAELDGMTPVFTQYSNVSYT